MYLRSNGGYYKGTEQCARRAPFLILFSWNDYKAADELRAACTTCQGLKQTRDAGIDRWNADPIGNAADRGAFDLPAACTEHTGVRTKDPAPVYPNGKPKLWAVVRQVALHQCGHFMMGAARIAGTRIPISGSCGADGLPRDYQEVPPAARRLLIEVPEDIATAYWQDNGHNTIGDSRQTVADWARTAFAKEL